MPLLLGCIADDLTGASDLALMLARNGLRVVQTIGVPSEPVPNIDAVVVSLKSRTIPANEAVAQSLGALRWLRAAGARQIFFKYCSTFDSTPAGNIGPVADALLDALDADFAIACPAFPANQRSVYQGHLFVGSVLLSESGMRHHPLTPMTNSNLVAVLAEQTPHKVGLVPMAEVDAGADAVKLAFAKLRQSGVRYAIVDAITEEHLRTIGAASADLALITGGSGIALGLPENFRNRGLASARTMIAPLPPAAGHAAVIAGSCSQATLGQIQAMQSRYPSFAVDPFDLAAGKNVVDSAVAWAASRLGSDPILIYASAPSEKIIEIQSRLGRIESGALIEHALASIAQGLVAAGVRRLVVAGGETSGAVVNSLGVRALQIGPEIDPGVPWTMSIGQPSLFLALKSGNFGGRDFFSKAFEKLR